VSRLLSGCPKCGAHLRGREVLAAGPFPCPNCHARLQARGSYAAWIGVGNVLASGCAFRLLGLGGLHLLYAVLLAWLPVQYAALHLVKYALPPRVSEYLPRDSTLRLRGGRGP
jgi:hypothetical protein